MTVSSTLSRAEYSGNGTTTAFSFPYYFLADGDLTVILVSSTGVRTTQTITTHYTIVGAGVSAGGTVSMVTAPATGEILIILREVALTQGADFVENDPLSAEVLEQALDRQTMIAQQHQEEIARSVRFSQSATDLPLAELTGSATDRANKTLAFDADGGLILDDTNINVSTITDNLTAITTVATDLNGVRTAFDYGSIASTDPVSNPASPTGTLKSLYDIRTDITTVGGIAGNVTTVATNNTNIASCVTNMTAIIAAPTSANDAAADAASAEIARAAAVVAKVAAELAEANAETAQTSAEAAYDSFDDRYLGSKTSAPSVDNDGNALLNGSLYWNSTSGGLKAYDTTASTWQPTAPSSADQTRINIVAGDLIFTEDLGSIADSLTTSTGSDISIVADDIVNVNSCAGSIANINTTAGAIANVNNTGGSIANVNTVSSSIADVNRYANEYKIASSAPSSPSSGDLWYDSTVNTLKYYTGSVWASISAGISDVVSDTTPQLGGALDCQGNNVTNAGTVSGANLQIDFGGLT